MATVALGKCADRKAVKASLRRYVEFGAFETRDLTDEEVTAARLTKCWSDTEEKHLYVAELRHLLRAMAKHDRDAAARFAAEIIGAVDAGLVVSKRVTVGKPADVAREATHVVLAAADAMRVQAEALSDGVVTAADRAEMSNAGLHLEREAAEFVAAAAAIGTAERSLC